LKLKRPVGRPRFGEGMRGGGHTHGVDQAPANGREGLHMETGWPYGEGTSETGEWPDEELADRAAARWQPPLEAPAAPVNVPAPRAKTAARVESLPGEQAMPDQRRPGPSRAEPAPVKSCWMCGIRSSADQMVADGGSACLDLRWYCRDTWACTERWTARSARPPLIGQDTETSTARARQATRTHPARPVAV
jgi:hypothetical protein